MPKKNKKIYLFCICTQNRNIQLLKTIKSIKKLNKDTNSIVKILVINNNIKNLQNDFRKFFYNIKVVNEKKIGISYARNRALYELSKIKTDYLCFVDDDCILDKNWLINNIKVLKKFNVKIITGPHISKNNFYLNITERNLKHESYTDWASTNNVMLNRSIIKSKNRFSLNIQKYGGEDQLFFKKFSNKGIKIIWNQTSKIYDISKKKRINFKWFAQRAMGHGACTLIIYEELNGKIYSYCFCVIKLFYDLTLSIIYTLRFLSFNKKYIYKSLYYFYRAYGNFLSMLSIRKKRY